jgi:hypothetical protein
MQKAKLDTNKAQGAGTEIKEGEKLSDTLPSSFGDSPREMTPKDITPEDASWKDRKVRDLASGDAVKREESLIDEAVELTFPASDPVAELPASAESEKAAQCHDCQEDLLDEAVELTFPASDPIAVPSITKVPDTRPQK